LRSTKSVFISPLEEWRLREYAQARWTKNGQLAVRFRPQVEFRTN